jgi:uncharacterized protein (TIGR04255 family)
MAKKALKPPYPAPPIVEAVVQVHFSEQLKKPVSAKMLKRLKAAYANNVVVQGVSANVDFQNRQTNFVEVDPQVRLSSDDQADVLIVQPDTLTWSRLAPYQGWEALLERVIRDFDVAHLATGHRKIDRLGVRYINRIDVPTSASNISYYEEFIRVHLTLPKFLDPTNGYAWRFEKVFPNDGFVAIVQSTSVMPVIPGTSPFIFDIDVVCSQNLPVKRNDVFSKLSDMRELKNNIFELSMTDKARMAFQ